jgi:tetratricopeptide (TPR) repeat protein
VNTDPDDPFARAKALYSEPLSPSRTREIEKLLKQDGDHHSLERQAIAERKAFEAIVRLCDYLNRWNGVGKMDVLAAEADIAAALVLNANTAAAYYAEGFIFRTKGEHERALASFQKSVAIDPNNARAVAQAGAEQLYLGFPNEALSAVRKALELSPDSPAAGMFRWIGFRALFFDGKYRESIPWLEQSIKTWPDLWYSRGYDVSVHALIGHEAAAKSKLADFIHRFPDLNTIERIVEAERTNPNTNPFVVEGRRKFHEGLAIAGMPASGRPASGAR